MIGVIGVIDVISWLFCQKFSLNHRVHVIVFFGAICYVCVVISVLRSFLSSDLVYVGV